MQPIRNLLLLFIISLATGFTTFAQKTIMVKPKAKEVTVYLSGAEIMFKETIPLKQGDNIVLFKGLSPSLVTNSVQVTVSNNASVISVSTQSEELNPEEVEPRIKNLKDSITGLEDQISV